MKFKGCGLAARHSCRNVAFSETLRTAAVGESPTSDAGCKNHEDGGATLFSLACQRQILNLLIGDYGAYVGSIRAEKCCFRLDFNTLRDFPNLKANVDPC